MRTAKQVRSDHAKLKAATEGCASRYSDAVKSERNAQRAAFADPPAKAGTTSAPRDENDCNDHYFEQLHEAREFVPEDGETDAERNQ